MAVKDILIEFFKTIAVIIIGSFLYQFFTSRDWGTALERSFFAILGCSFFLVVASFLL
jgi:hypothetical protein